MRIIDNRTHKKVKKCNICKRNIEWKLENGKYVPYLLTGEKDVCYVIKK